LLELLEAGVEEPIARHIAHLFVRDPLVLFSEKVDQEDEKEIDHFDVRKVTISFVVRYPKF